MTTATYTIVGGDYESGGSASRQLKLHLKQIGAEPAVVRRAMVAAYEAEMNVVIHARRGALRFCLDNGQLDVEITDEGPGIADVEQALRPGFSTAPAPARELGFGAGMGLPNIQKNTDEFTIESTPGEGTRLRFRIHLRPQALYGQGHHSIQAIAERCRASFHCLRVCPTQAIRVRGRRPEILDYLCTDCGACLGVCPNNVWEMAATSAELAPTPEKVLVLAPEALVQFGSGVSPQRVLAGLRTLGFHDVVVTEPWQRALSDAVLAVSRAGDQPYPVISPACPAIANLVELRFPALIPHLAPFVSPMEAAVADLDGRPVACVVSCPCQRTALLATERRPTPEIVSPLTFRAALAPRLRSEPAATESMPAQHDSAHADAGVLRVNGLLEAIAVLERIENGLAGDVAVLEAYACPAAGFGSPLWSEPAALARLRWEAAEMVDERPARAVPRRTPYKPRPGLRLDADMARAVQKLGRIDKLTQQLPGDDCALCGAPTCAAFAEDVVLGRAHQSACVRQCAGAKETQ